MKFFKSMSPKEKSNWNKSAVLGFYTFMGLLAVNYMSSLIIGRDLFSSAFLFFTGLVITFGYEAYLNVKKG
jgi:predicted membrane channel-forming protein YqfA (hemolysin III family)